MNTPQGPADIEKRPISFLEWAGAILGFLALFAEILRRSVFDFDAQSGDLWFNLIIFVSLAVSLSLMLPTLFREWFSPRRGVADHYLALVMVVIIAASIYVGLKDWTHHFVGVLPIILAGYAICKNKYRAYQNCLEAVSEKLHKNKLPEVEVVNEAEGNSQQPPSSSTLATPSASPPESASGCPASSPKATDPLTRHQPRPPPPLAASAKATPSPR